VSALGISKDSKNVVTTPSIEENKSNSKFYVIPVNGPNRSSGNKGSTKGQKHFPDGKYLVYSEEVKINDVLGKDFYPNLEKSEVQIYDGFTTAIGTPGMKVNLIMYFTKRLMRMQ
jgi:hypothetical protein